MSLDPKPMRDLEDEEETKDTAFEEFVNASKALQDQLKKTQESSDKVLESLRKLAQ